MRQLPLSSLRSSRCFSTTNTTLEQSVAVKKEEDVNDVSAQQPREPEQRITMADRHQREARQSIGKRRDPLAFMASARNAPDGGAPQQQAPSTSTSQAIRTNRNPSDAFLVENADNPAFDFMQKKKAIPPSRQRPASTDNQPQSISDLLASIHLNQPGPGNKPSTNSYSRINVDNMQLPNRPQAYDPLFGGGSVPARIKLDATAAPSFRISPSLGRTVNVDNARNVDVARAFRMVEMKCNSNSVKQDLNKQRFHERPGIRRKRLVMSRWRRRFKEAFKATVRRVEDMRRKGW